MSTDHEFQRKVVTSSVVPKALTEIAREYTFDAAHQLHWHAGKCANLHGHTYRLVVCIRGGLDEHGVVMDFGHLDDVVQDRLLQHLDHTYLNEAIDNPTAEEIARYAWSKLAAAGLDLSELTLWETGRSWVRLVRDE